MAGHQNFVKISGAWKQGYCYVKKSGNWYPAVVWVKVSGVWKSTVNTQKCATPTVSSVYPQPPNYNTGYIYINLPTAGSYAVVSTDRVNWYSYQSTTQYQLYSLYFKAKKDGWADSDIQSL